METKRITRIWIAGLIAGSSVCTLVVYPEPSPSDDTELFDMMNQNSNYTRINDSEGQVIPSGYKLWNYVTHQYEHPNCEGDTDCEWKYGNEEEIIVESDRRL